MPLSLNISFGNTYGSHDGTTLVSSYINSVIDGNRISVQIGTGNEGDGIGHTSGYAFFLMRMWNYRFRHIRNP